MRSYKGKEIHTESNPYDDGFQQGRNDGVYSERRRISEQLGISTGTLALLGVNKDQDIIALGVIRTIIAGRIIQLTAEQALGDQKVNVDGV